ncbi:MAG: hypothetical protein JW870_19150 [Candidatus Delongbacteria bacterium]|nr:hypothetical protein [Candidatus Delongbacteria bacterium]
MFVDRKLNIRKFSQKRNFSNHKGFLYELLSNSWKLLLPIATIVVLIISGIEGTYSVPIFFIFFLLLGLLIVCFLVCSEDKKVSIKLFISIFTYNTLIVVFFFFIFQIRYGNHYLSGGTDDMYYEYLGRYAANSLKTQGEIVIPRVENTMGRSPYRYEKYRTFITIIAGVYFMSDVIADDMHTLNVRIMNSLAIGLISVFAFSLAIMCGLSKPFSFIGAFAAGIYTPQAFWGAVIIRDIWIVLLCIASVFFFKRLITSNKRSFWKYLLFFSLMTYSISLFRVQSAILIIAAFCLFVVFYTLKRKGIIIKTGFLILYLLLLIFLFSSTVEYINNELTPIIIRHTNYRMNFAYGLSKFIFGLPLIPFGMVIRPLYALISPFPSFSLDVQPLFENVSTIGVILMLPYVFIGFFRSISKKNLAILGIAPLILLLGTSWTTSHFRHLLVYMPYIFLLMAYGWSTLKKPIRLLYISIFVNSFFFLIYISLKTFGG